MSDAQESGSEGVRRTAPPENEPVAEGQHELPNEVDEDPGNPVSVDEPA